MNKDDKLKLEDKLKLYQQTLAKNNNKTFLDGVSLYSEQIADREKTMQGLLDNRPNSRDTVYKLGLDVLSGFAAGAMDSKTDKAYRDKLSSDAALTQARADQINSYFKTG